MLTRTSVTPLCYVSVAVIYAVSFNIRTGTSRFVANAPSRGCLLGERADALSGQHSLGRRQKRRPLPWRRTDGRSTCSAFWGGLNYRPAGPGTVVQAAGSSARGPRRTGAGTGRSRGCCTADPG